MVPTQEIQTYIADLEGRGFGIDSMYVNTLVHITIMPINYDF